MTHRPLWPSPLCETGPQHLSTPLPRPLVGSQQPALLEPERGLVLTRSSPGEEGSKMALFGLVSNQGGPNTAALSAVPCSSKTTSSKRPSMTVQLAPIPQITSPCSILWDNHFRLLFASFLFPPTRMQAPGRGALSLHCRPRYPGGQAQS